MHLCTALTACDGTDNKTHDSTNVLVRWHLAFSDQTFSLFENRAWFSGRAKHLLGWKASITLTGEQSVAKSLHRLSVVRGGIIVGGIIVRLRNFNSRQFRAWMPHIAHRGLASCIMMHIGWCWSECKEEPRCNYLGPSFANWAVSTRIAHSCLCTWCL